MSPCRVLLRTLDLLRCWNKCNTEQHCQKQDCGRDFKNQDIHAQSSLFSIWLCKTSTRSCGIDTLLLFLPTSVRTAFNDLGHLIDAKLARLKRGLAIETERFRQAQYLKWCKQKFIPDPCRKEPGYEQIVVCFIENLILNCNPRSKTVLG